MLLGTFQSTLKTAAKAIHDHHSNMGLEMFVNWKAWNRPCRLTVIKVLGYVSFFATSVCGANECVPAHQVRLGDGTELCVTSVDAFNRPRGNAGSLAQVMNAAAFLSIAVTKYPERCSRVIEYARGGQEARFNPGALNPIAIQNCNSAITKAARDAGCECTTLIDHIGGAPFSKGEFLRLVGAQPQDNVTPVIKTVAQPAGQALPQPSPTTPSTVGTVSNEIDKAINFCKGDRWLGTEPTIDEGGATCIRWVIGKLLPSRAAEIEKTALFSAAQKKVSEEITRQRLVGTPPTQGDFQKKVKHIANFCHEFAAGQTAVDCVITALIGTADSPSSTSDDRKKINGTMLGNCNAIGMPSSSVSACVSAVKDQEAFEYAAYKKTKLVERQEIWKRYGGIPRSRIDQMLASKDEADRIKAYCIDFSKITNFKDAAEQEIFVDECVKYVDGQNAETNTGKASNTTTNKSPSTVITVQSEKTTSQKLDFVLGKITDKTTQFEMGAGCVVSEAQKTERFILAKWKDPKGDWLNVNGKDTQLQDIATPREQSRGVSKYLHLGVRITATPEEKVMKTGRGKGEILVELNDLRRVIPVYFSCSD